MIAVWARFLHAVPSARLLILTVPRGPGARDADAEFRRPRHSRCPPCACRQAAVRRFPGAFKDADIALDPFPFAGTTTTCQTLWMGVPVVTLAGASHAGRVGVSMLTNVGLPDLVARDEDEIRRRRGGPGRRPAASRGAPRRHARRACSRRPLPTASGWPVRSRRLTVNVGRLLCAPGDPGGEPTGRERPGRRDYAHMIRIFIGYDQREAVAYHVLSHSIQRRASEPVAIAPLRLSQLGGVLHAPAPPAAEHRFLVLSRFLTPLSFRLRGLVHLHGLRHADARRYREALGAARRALRGDGGQARSTCRRETVKFLGEPQSSTRRRTGRA